MTPDRRIEDLLQIVITLTGEMHAGRVPLVRPDSHLDMDLGLDSLARAELLLRIEQAFDVRLPELTLAEAETPADLWRAVHRATTSNRGAGPLPTMAALPERAERGFSAPSRAATLIEVLRVLAREHAERVHVHFLQAGQLSETLTYGQLWDQAGRVAAGLLRRGLRPGASIALMLPSGPDFFRAFYGILIAGGVPVPIYPPARITQIEEHLGRQAGILENCQAFMLIVTAEVRLPGRMLQARVAGLAHVVTLAELSETALSLNAAELPVVNAADTAFLQYTSGSTGHPKGVVLSHANLLANIRAWSRAIELGAEDVCVSWLPLYHDMGLIGAWLGSLYNGLTLVLMSPLDFLARPQNWLWAIHRYRGTISAAPNFAYELCARRIAAADIEGLDLSSWRLAANGAEPVNPETLARFCERFAPHGFRPTAMAPVYGLAECTVGLAVSPPGRGPRIERVERALLQQNGEARLSVADDALAVPSCGKPLPGHQIRISDEDGQPLPERRVGHLEFRGPSATAGYYRNPEATRRLWRGAPGEGWLDSGDLAYCADGEVYLTGRVKDLMIRAGRNLYPYELEAAIGSLPEVRRGCVAVFGVADPHGGSERLVAVVETRSPEQRDDALLRHIEAQSMRVLGEPLDDVVLAPPGTVLKTSSGKIRRAAIRDHYLAGTLGNAAHAPIWQVLRLMADALKARGGRMASTLAQNLFALWAWGWFILLTPIAWLAVCIGGRAAWPVARWAARGLLRLTGAGPALRGLEHLPASGPCVLVANHASYLDPLLLSAVLTRLPVFVAKRELVGNWFARQFLEALGCEFVERFEATQGVADARRLSARLKAGESLMLFPEATFQKQPGLLPFRLGAFQAAVDAAVPVLPIAILGTRAALPDGTWKPRRHRLELIVAAPILPSGHDWKATLALRDEARRSLLPLVGEPDQAP